MVLRRDWKPVKELEKKAEGSGLFGSAVFKPGLEWDIKESSLSSFGGLDLPISKAMPLLVWVDMETTGTDPYRDKILEFSACATSLDGKVIGQFFHTLVQNDGYSVENDAKGLDESASIFDPKVREMHEKSGLLRELREDRLRSRESAESKGGLSYVSWLSEHELEPAFMSWVIETSDIYREVIAPNARIRDRVTHTDLKPTNNKVSLVFAGYSPNLDFNFTAHRMPTASKMFSNRTFDLSSIQMLLCSAHPGDKMLLSERPHEYYTPGIRHRSLTDVMRSVENYSWIVDDVELESPLVDDADDYDVSLETAIGLSDGCSRKLRTCSLYRVGNWKAVGGLTYVDVLTHVRDNDFTESLLLVGNYVLNTVSKEDFNNVKDLICVDSGVEIGSELWDYKGYEELQDIFEEFGGCPSLLIEIDSLTKNLAKKTVSEDSEVPVVRTVFPTISYGESRCYGNVFHGRKRNIVFCKRSPWFVVADDLEVKCAEVKELAPSDVDSIKFLIDMAGFIEFYGVRFRTADMPIASRSYLREVGGPKYRGSSSLRKAMRKGLTHLLED